jgi:probable HAF family extracellular repeat protein
VGVASFHGFFYSHGQYRQGVNFPGATRTSLSDLNDSKKIVGETTTQSGEEEGIGFFNGSFLELQYPGVTSTQVWGINKRGDVVGSYVDANGREHGFLYTGAANQ